MSNSFTSTQKQWIITVLICVVGLILTAAAPVPIRPDGIAPVAPATVTARITLQTGAFDTDDWTVVQWQDQSGYWHDVTGWQGHFLEDGTVVWWVSAEQLGQQSFRWIVYEDSNRGQWKAWSPEFDLPTSADEIVEVEAR